MQVSAQVPMPMVYETIRMEVDYRLDMFVENIVIIEVKSVETLLDIHHKQLITYLKLSGCKLGILVNFNTDNIANSILEK